MQNLWESDSSSESDGKYQALLLLAWKRRMMKRRRRRRRTLWVRPIFRRRRHQGEYHNLLQEMRLSDPDSHFRYLRMSKERFACLLSMVCYIPCTYYTVIASLLLIPEIQIRLLLCLLVEVIIAHLEQQFH